MSSDSMAIDSNGYLGRIVLREDKLRITSFKLEYCLPIFYSDMYIGTWVRAWSKCNSLNAVGGHELALWCGQQDDGTLASFARLDIIYRTVSYTQMYVRQSLFRQATPCAGCQRLFYRSFIQASVLLISKIQNRAYVKRSAICTTPYQVLVQQ